MATDYKALSMELHEELRGKIEVTPRASVSSAHDLSIAYTPGVAAPCLAIQREPERSFELTRRWNTVAVVTDGSAVLGLGNIGPEAGMPVMEGKCVLFKAFGGVDAIPLCLRTNDVDEIVRTVSLIAGSFGGINLEDIAAPRCFEIEPKLQAAVDIPVFHDDQHGTAVVVAAGLINALKLTGREFASLRVVQNGPGAAGTAIIKMLRALGVEDIVAVDRAGIIEASRPAGCPGYKAELAEITNPRHLTGGLAEALPGADVFIGTSAPGTLTADMVREMAADPIVFACANPDPEIAPDEALAAGAAVVSTGRSDYPNQVNNVLVFPGLFRGALDARASRITDGMKVAAAYALAGLVSDDELSASYIIPEPFDPRVRDAVAKAVADAAREDGVARA